MHHTKISTTNWRQLTNGTRHILDSLQFCVHGSGQVNEDVQIQR